jgi:hypothetical protein
MEAVEAAAETSPSSPHSPGRRWFVVRTGALVLSWGAVIAAVLALLHGLAIFPLVEEVLPVTGSQHLDGLTYSAPMPPDPPFVPWTRAERLHENGRPSRFPMVAGYGVISKSGGGRYHISSNTLFFSASDNSDPRANGRQYTLHRPLSLSSTILVALFIGALLGLAILVSMHRTTVAALLTRPPFLLPAAVFLVFVAANRIWVFVEYPIAAIHPDSASYYALYDQLLNGEAPNFGRRPPVYPLFMAAVFAFADRVMTLTAIQTLLSTLAGLTLVYALYRWRRWLAIPAAIAIGGYLLSTAAMEHDTGMLSESLYSTLLVFSFAALLLGLRGVWPAFWMTASSTGMGLAVLTRPAGMFLVVTFGIVLAFLLWNRYAKRTVMSFAAPMPVLLLAMCVYNWRTIEVFAISSWGEANLAVGTFTYWEPDPAYPPDINRGIAEIKSFIDKRLKETSVDPAILKTSWDPVELSRVFILGFHGGPLDVAMRMGTGNYETSGREWIRRIAFDAIRKQPDVDAKFVYSMLYNYFRPWQEFDFRSYLMNRTQALFVERRYSASHGNPLLPRVGKEFADGTPPSNVIVTSFDPAAPIDLSERVLITPTPGWRLYELTHRWRRVVFNRWVWPAAAMFTLVVSVAFLVGTRGRSVGAFAAFIVTVSMVGASLVISLVEYSQPRYSYPMEWTYFIAPLLLVLVGVRSTTQGKGALGA